jgi:hypothetical protein
MNMRLNLLNISLGKFEVSTPKNSLVVSGRNYEE